MSKTPCDKRDCTNTYSVKPFRFKGVLYNLCGFHRTLLEFPLSIQ